MSPHVVATYLAQSWRLGKCGAAPLPSIHAAESDDLVCILDSPPPQSYSIYFFAHRELRNLPRVDAFFKFCSRELKAVFLPRTSAQQ